MLLQFEFQSQSKPEESELPSIPLSKDAAAVNKDGLWPFWSELQEQRVLLMKLSDRIEEIYTTIVDRKQKKASESCSTLAYNYCCQYLGYNCLAVFHIL
jgi:hypothetical protein